MVPYFKPFLHGGSEIILEVIDQKTKELFVSKSISDDENVLRNILY